MFDTDNEVLGRALLWSGVDVDGRSRNVLDRIYTIRDSDIEAFKEYAAEKDWLYKAEQNYTSKDAFIDKGEVKYHDLTIELENCSFSYYPYVDTFTYMDGYYLSNEQGSYEFSLDVTDGIREGDDDNEVHDDYNGGHVCEHEAVYCEYGGGYTHEDDACYIEYKDRYAFPNRCTWSDRENRYLLLDDAVELANGEVVHADNAYYSDVTENYYTENDCVFSDYHETYIPIEDAVELENGVYVMSEDEHEAIEHYGLIEEESGQELPQAA